MLVSLANKLRTLMVRKWEIKPALYLKRILFPWDCFLYFLSWISINIILFPKCLKSWHDSTHPLCSWISIISWIYIGLWGDVGLHSNDLIAKVSASLYWLVDHTIYDLKKSFWIYLSKWEVVSSSALKHVLI